VPERDAPVAAVARGRFYNDVVDEHAKSPLATR